jgi:hypothetical protein
MTALNKAIQDLFKNVQYWREDMHPYQEKAVQFLLDHPFSALFIDLGLGKTVSSLTLCRELLLQDLSHRILVIAPKRVANETWPTEIGLWHHTCFLSWAHIRDEDLTGYITAAGKKAAKLAKTEGVNNPEVKKLTDRIRLQDIKARFKKNGLKLRPNRDRIKSAFQKVELNPVTDKERRLFTKTARALAAKTAVREHFWNNPASIHIISRDHVEFLVRAWGNDWPYDTVIIDESSSFKDISTKRFKEMRMVRPHLKRMHQLTATPAAETYLHLFAQIYLLDQGARFGKSFNDFRDEYFTHNPYSHAVKLKEGAEERIAEKIADICLTMRAEDYLDIKKPIPVLHPIKFSPELRKQYDDFERDRILDLPNDKEIRVDTAADLSNKLLQFCSGFVYETEVKEVRGKPRKVKTPINIHNLKIESLQEIRESCGDAPLLVVYHFEHSLERLRAAFPDAVVMDDEGKAVKRWNQKKIPMLLVHPQSAGHGLNLQYGGNQIVFFDHPWSNELYLQVIGRLNRQGQANAVILHFIYVAQSHDEMPIQAHETKQDLQELLFTWLKKKRAELRTSSTGHTGSKTGAQKRTTATLSTMSQRRCSTRELASLN